VLTVDFRNEDALVFLQSLANKCVFSTIIDPPYGSNTYAWDTEPSPEVWQEIKRVTKGPIAIMAYAKQLFRWARYFDDLNLIGFIVWHKFNEPAISPGLTRVHQDIAIFGKTITQLNSADVREPYEFNQNEHLVKFFGQGGNNELSERLADSKSGMRKQPHPDGRRCSDLWRIAVSHHGFNAHLRLHPNQKPDELLNKLIRLLTKEGETILDCYSGSGTTGYNAVKLNRHFIGCELNQTYFDVANKRIRDANQQLHLI
jgi:site-specific DNA-methyltransferase (adenine-specific)